ncbi:mediator of RNA polymerase II transcription subunit 15a-like [Quillaja saponaria]|uniref:Mediator of RNA polymerase II transcription subunit 15a-like n=1 Tax=Quillaja saponaria TaxID=32244 RepID=A0AAD7L5H0_QUISA|nr:mediator of RNA polymerase II transcription subunit 15a-like [Quillaja saponaria]
MDTGDCWTGLHPDSRQRIVNKVVETLKKHLPASGPEGLHELAKAAERFEEKIYTAATSQYDYLRKISLKMLTMEKKSQNTMASSLPTNSGGNNNFQPVQGGEPTMDTGDWRTGLHPGSRQRIVNKIMEILKKHLPVFGQEGLHELKKIAERFEEKIYTAATSQSDYLRKMSLKMVTMETKSQTTI